MLKYDSARLPSKSIQGETVTVREGIEGVKTVTYNVVYENGVEVSREVLSSDTYSPMNKIINRGITVEVPPVQETPIEPVQPKTNTLFIL
mgnify:CR=1 FL=1